jgi:hypothetical protein
MKRITCFNDLRPFGIEPLTGEACGLMYRILCDVTAEGVKVLEKCLSARVTPADAWNRGDPDRPHVGSVMLSPAMLVPLGIFALLESGCREVWLYQNGSMLGIEAADSAQQVELCRKMAPEALVRAFGYHGTAGDRNVHVMTGRTV